MTGQGLAADLTGSSQDPLRTLLGSQNLIIAGAQDLRSSGTQDFRISGSQDPRISGSSQDAKDEQKTSQDPLSVAPPDAMVAPLIVTTSLANLPLFWLLLTTGPLVTEPVLGHLPDHLRK